MANNQNEELTQNPEELISHLHLGVDGIVIETQLSKVAIHYDFPKNAIMIRGGNVENELVNLHVSGKIRVSGVEILEKINSIDAHLQELKQKVDEIFFAPGMPGYEIALESWNQSLQDRVSERAQKGEKVSGNSIL